MWNNCETEHYKTHTLLFPGKQSTLIFFVLLSGGKVFYNTIGSTANYELSLRNSNSELVCSSCSYQAYSYSWGHCCFLNNIQRSPLNSGSVNSDR